MIAKRIAPFTGQRSTQWITLSNLRTTDARLLKASQKKTVMMVLTLFMLLFRRISKSAVDTTLEDKRKELMEESRMLLVQFSIDRVSLGVHSMGNVFVYNASCSVQY